MADNEEEEEPSRLTKLIGTGKEELLTRANMKPTVLVVLLFKAVETVPLLYLSG